MIVTAQKRSENLQDVPISLESISNESIEELNIQNFKDLRAVPAERADAAVHATRRSGYNLVYMRGVATGGDGQAITSQPSVGTVPRRAADHHDPGNLDVHLYDIARVEALAGPQGTLYGASSQAGTIRIITNKPDPSAFAAGYSLEGNYVDMDDVRLRRRGLRQHPDGRQRGAAPRGLGEARRGLDRQRAKRPASISGD